MTRPEAAPKKNTASATQRVVVIGGDGIGPEVTREAVLVLEGYRERGLPLELVELDLGAERYLRDGVTFPDEARECVDGCRAVLLGALGDARVPGFEHARDILFGMRFGLDLYANVRPVRALSDRLVPLKGRTARDVDLVVFRENSEGAYAGIGGRLRPNTRHEVAITEDISTYHGVRRILVAAFEHARERARHGEQREGPAPGEHGLEHGRRERQRVCMVDKSNALRDGHALWLRSFEEVGRDYPDVEQRHLYVDAFCAALVADPSQFDVVVTNNLFGDIISDLGAALIGGVGMAPSANVHVGDPLRPALFEPVHGSAPDLVGRGVANPFGAILSAGLLLGHLGHPEAAAAVETAVCAALQAGECTLDVGGKLGTVEVGERLRRRLFE